MCTRTVTVLLRSARRLLVMDNVVASSQIHATLMMVALSFSESSVLTRVTRRNIQEDGILPGNALTPTSKCVLSIY
jgi:hypothetical protein